MAIPPLPVIYLYIKDNTNELMARFSSTKAENQKRQSERMKETTLIHKRGSWQSSGEKEMEKQNTWLRAEKKSQQPEVA